MTVRECYEELGSDFDKVLSRLVSEALVKKFALKFLDDPSFGQLETALADKDDSISCSTYTERYLPEPWI